MIVAGLLLAVAIAVGAFLGGIVTEGRSAQPGRDLPASVATALADAAPGPVGRSTALQVRELEDDVVRRPRDVAVLTALGYGYLQRWRETADASFLPRASEALDRARTLRPGDPLVLTGLGSLALTQHEFRRALSIGRDAVQAAPDSARPYGVVGDALLELGRYPQAFATFERMVAIRPSVASYARVAYARELTGDRAGASAAMQLALDAAGGQPEASAWVSVELAKLDLASGRLAPASHHVADALTLVPGYVFAEELRARIEAARGHLSAAIRIARRAAESVPLPQIVSLLADLEERAGRTAAARRDRATVIAIDRLIAANGIRSDIEVVLFDADHRLGTTTLVERARAARSARPSIWGDDALAWALARTGRCDEARVWSKRSLRLGTRDGLLSFHRAAIEDCAGNRAAARTWARRALAGGPAFSVRWAPVARELAR